MLKSRAMKVYAELVGRAGNLGLDGCLIDEHDGDVVLHQIDAMALRALQALGVLAVVERLLAGGADQNLEKIFGKHDQCIVRQAPVAPASLPAVAGSGQTPHAANGKTPSGPGSVRF